MRNVRDRVADPTVASQIFGLHLHGILHVPAGCRVGEWGRARSGDGAECGAAERAGAEWASAECGAAKWDGAS